jgi:hypothetical protein
VEKGEKETGGGRQERGRVDKIPPSRNIRQLAVFPQVPTISCEPDYRLAFHIPTCIPKGEAFTNTHVTKL